MQINTLRAQAIHKEKYQPRKNACLISDQTRKTIKKKDTTHTFVKIQRPHATRARDITNAPRFFWRVFPLAPCVPLPDLKLPRFGPSRGPCWGALAALVPSPPVCVTAQSARRPLASLRSAAELQESQSLSEAASALEPLNSCEHHSNINDRHRRRAHRSSLLPHSKVGSR